MAKDLAVMTHLLRLKTLPSLEAPAVRGVAPSINALAERFVAGLQAASPSSVHTILATACKLQARLLRSLAVLARSTLSDVIRY